MDYSPDGIIWFTDEKHHSVWKFNIQDEEYRRFSFTSNDNSLPQRLKIQGSNFIVNDFKGNQIVVSDYTRLGEENSKFVPSDDKFFIIVNYFECYIFVIY